MIMENSPPRQHQAMSRHNEAWKESLRYRRPNLDCMSGLRRITLNGNPLVDNEGAASLAEAVKDDMWVKAIDLQQCGIGNAGAKAFLNVLKLNSTLTVLDLRQNPLIGKLHLFIKNLLLIVDTHFVSVKSVKSIVKVWN